MDGCDWQELLEPGLSVQGTVRVCACCGGDGVFGWWGRIEDGVCYPVGWLVCPLCDGEPERPVCTECGSVLGWGEVEMVGARVVCGVCVAALRRQLPLFDGVRGG